ncbi:FAD-binding oxidoreductase, partial [Actinoplanes sp. NPDC051411]|uniref:FAD-binding oxidoreductase n=1 Tax=Actinoplanes sp. NPDC051411 TaxID=3155522 RepID=UPI003425F97D
RPALPPPPAPAAGAPPARPPPPPRDRFRGLADRLDGDLIRPGDPRYPVARQLDNGYFDTVEPAAIAYCASVADVRTVLGFAQDRALPTAIRSGGHSAAGYSTTTGLVLDVSRLNRIDVGRSTVAVGPGTQAVDVLGTLAAHGIAAVTGNCPTVCAGGYLQGGGIGPLARKFGVASDHLVAAEVVLADGTVENVSARHHPDLFWALRGGGGGNFGVVTRFEITPVRADRMVTYALVWSWDRTADVIAAYQTWAEQAPEDLVANLNLVLPNATPGATPSVSVSGGWLGGDPDGLTPQLDALIAAVGVVPLRNQVTDQTYTASMMRTFGCADLSTAQCHRTGATPQGTLARHTFVVNRGRLLTRPLPAPAIDRLLTAFESAPADGQLRVVSWAALGGRINRVAPDATAYVHRSARHYVAVTAQLPVAVPDPDARAAAQSWADGCFEIVAAHGREGQVNFIDPRLPDWRTAYYGQNYPRLAAVKRSYDRYGFFRFPQAVGR